MAMATNFVTLGELWSSHVEMEEEDEAIFSRIKVLIENQKFASPSPHWNW
ncbi:unnamed protein product [Acanthoscelides obtectus]|uniref:Uncharacterized protein n=1 Tax=Acanthoscelides obtectus TaxID=200917 RepID=A0A9P0KXT0_ACAOB|nr:unnamed protein product [Acanthoscelides obtectus]CAK1678243.1 hypothetical protein AOBTE_LOCUS31796 [Acanthoscelides obtectus]